MSNPTRQHILCQIDEVGYHHISTTELEQAFNHEKHWLNWAKVWHLNVIPHEPGVLRFERQPKAF